MRAIKDGGPAFPAEGPSVGQFDSPGLSMRDYFAAKAMHAELMTAGVPGDACNALVHEAERNGCDIEEQVAWNAYRMADAMLAAREVQP